MWLLISQILLVLLIWLFELRKLFDIAENHIIENV